MTRLSVRLFGSFDVTLDGEPVTGFATDKARALLAYLAVEANRTHRREALAGLLWPDSPEPSARASLRSALVALRRAIGDRETDQAFLYISRQTIQFNCESDAWVDVKAFTDLLDSKDPGAQITRRLEEAVALYRGDFLEGFSLPDSGAFEEWALLTREMLRRRAVEALEQLVDRYEAAGEYEAALPRAWRQVELDPWRERAQRQLMRLLALSGQKGAALAQYEACRILLAKELGVEPAPGTTALRERILAGEIAASAEATGSRPHNLPLQPTPFVGREEVLAEIVERLEEPTCRLLTLVGPGGCGKTRLALEAAAAQLERYPHGVYFISLAPLDGVEAILPTVADGVCFTFYEGGEPQQQLLDYLRGKKMLLVMDNYEHLLEPSDPACKGGAALVTDILRTAPDVKILATSRARLNVGGEFRYPISGMLYPDPEKPALGWEDHVHRAADAVQVAVQVTSQYSAIKLFLQGARRARPGFKLTDENLSGVVQICRLVEGMPLAIRLAAPWVTVLSPQEIASELSRSLDLLATDRRGVPARQRSVRATLDHTWRLLTGRERALMQALSIFRGGFTREAAQQVAGAALRELMALADKSLLQPTLPGRYEIHELSRQYTQEKLDQAPDGGVAARNRHCAFYCTALERWGTDLKGARQQTALAEIEAESGNVRAAWDWAVDWAQVVRLDQAVDGLCTFYEILVRYAEGETACRVAAERLAGATSTDGLRLRARVLAWQGFFERLRGHVARAGRLLAHGLVLLESLELAELDTRGEKAFLLLRMGDQVLDTDRKAAQERYQDSLHLYQALGDRWGMAYALEGLGRVARNTGDYVRAEALVNESLDHRRHLSDLRGAAASLAVLRQIFTHLGRNREAVAVSREALEISERLCDRAGVAQGLWTLAGSYLGTGEFIEARSMAERAGSIANELGLRLDLAHSYSYFTTAEIKLGHYKNARAVGQKGLALSRETGLQYRVGWNLHALALVAIAQDEYTEAWELLQKAIAILRQIGQPVDAAWSVGGLGIVACVLGELTQARANLAEALRAAAEHQISIMLVYALPATALLLAEEGSAERAMEIYALASSFPFVANSRFFEDVLGKRIAAAAANLPPNAVATAQERGRARDLWATVEELAVELEGG